MRVTRNSVKRNCAPKFEKGFCDVKINLKKLKRIKNYNEELPVVDQSDQSSEAVQADRKDSLFKKYDISTPCVKRRVLKPFKAVYNLGNMSFIADEPPLKLSEKENAPEVSFRTRSQSYIRKPGDVYEFTPEFEEDCDPTANVVKKMISEGKAKMVKWKPGITKNCRKKSKTISQYLRSVERYRLKNFKKIIGELPTSHQKIEKNQELASTCPQNHAPSIDLEISKASDGITLNTNVDHSDGTQERIGNVSKDVCKDAENPKNIQILDVVVLPYKAPIKPLVAAPENQSEDAIDNSPVMEYSNNIHDTVDMLQSESPTFDFPDENSNECYLLKEEPDYFDSTAIEKTSLATTNPTCEGARTPVEMCQPKQTKPLRKAFWEEDEEEDNLDKTVIKKTYSRPKKKERRSHFFIFFSDDETSTVDEVVESEYYTRSRIQDWVKRTESANKKGKQLERNKNEPLVEKRPVLRSRNNINDNSMENLQKQNKKEVKVNKIKQKENISSLHKVKRRSTRQLHSLRL